MLYCIGQSPRFSWRLPIAPLLSPFSSPKLYFPFKGGDDRQNCKSLFFESFRHVQVI